MDSPKKSSLMMLMYRYESPHIPLEIVVKDFFNHMQMDQAKRRAAKQDFPFPVYRLEKSTKAPFFVSVEALANYLDNQAKMGKQDFDNLHHAV